MMATEGLDCFVVWSLPSIIGVVVSLYSIWVVCLAGGRAAGRAGRRRALRAAVPEILSTYRSFYVGINRDLGDIKTETTVAWVSVSSVKSRSKSNQTESVIFLQKKNS
jgi:hypothetical protein